MGAGLGSSLGFITNGSGLSAYTRGASHTAATPGTSWVSDSVISGSILCNLHGIYDLSAMDVWNFNSSNSFGVQRVSVLGSVDGINFLPPGGTPGVFQRLQAVGATVPLHQPPALADEPVQWHGVDDAQAQDPLTRRHHSPGDQSAGIHAAADRALAAVAATFGRLLQGVQSRRSDVRFGSARVIGQAPSTDRSQSEARLRRRLLRSESGYRFSSGRCLLPTTRADFAGTGRRLAHLPSRRVRDLT